MASKYKYQKRIKAIFRGYEFRQYTECLKDGFSWVEFWVAKSPRLFQDQDTHLTLQQLQRLGELLGTDDIIVTAGDIGMYKNTQDHAAYVLVQGVRQ